MPISRRRRRRTRVAPGSSRSGSADLSINRSRKKRANYWYIGASAVIAVLVIGGFAVGGAGFGHGGGPSRTGSSQQYVEGVGVSQDEMPSRTHVPESQTVEYNTVPPTSGDHWARWSGCGFFEHPLADERIVHNLEHGNIVISYNLATPEEVEQLKDVVEGIGLSSVWGVTRAYDKIPEGTVALAAWTVLDSMQGIDEDRIRTFYETYAGNLGPERIVCSQSGVMDPPPEDSGS